jgi:secreted PhoX family phosphatase
MIHDGHPNKLGAMVPATAWIVIATMFAIGQAGAQELVRIATMPSGAEVTGLSRNAAGELFLNAQHPGGKNTFGGDASAATVGYVQGLRPEVLAGSGLSLSQIKDRNTVNVARGRYITLARAGDKMGSGELFGGVYDTSGKLMFVSNMPDFNGFVPVDDGLAYLYTAWEGGGRDGASAVSRLLLRRKDDQWTTDMSQSRNVDLASIGGGAVLCSGVITPWNTPLIAEEYFFYNTAMWNHPDNHDEDERASFQNGNDITYIKPKSMNRYLGRMANPYRYGYMIEITDPTSARNEKPVKHFAMGRMSHETAAIMSDNKTVYMTDDDSADYSHATYNTASGGVLFKFVADEVGNLRNGTLYAAKLKQDPQSDPAKAGFDVSWIELGYGNSTEIEGWISSYDDVSVADYKDGQTSYITDEEIHAWAEAKSGNDLNSDGAIALVADARAPFLESRRTAAAMGATNEWDKLEGITARDGRLYVSASALSFTMDRSWGHKDWSSGLVDRTNAGAIALDAEQCGGTYVADIDNGYSITRLRPYIIGKTMPDGSCDPDRPASPDNILALDEGMLLIGEDAGPKRHVLDMLWLVRP